MDKKEPTPVRNIRIPDHLWHRLEALAKKRSVSRTTLLIEGIHLVLAAGEDEGSTLASPLSRPVSVPATLTDENDELKRQMQALAAEFEALKEHVEALEAQVHAQLNAHVDAFEERFQTLEKLGTKQVLTVNLPLTPTEPEDAHNLGTKQVLDVKTPLTQTELAHRLRTSTQNLSNRRGRGRPKDKAHFEAWSKTKDPEGIAWTWQGKPQGKGVPMRYVPKPPTPNP